MSSRFKFACSFCETSYESEAILRVHEEAEHAGEMFRCLACTQTVSLFPSYGLASKHSRLMHEISVEAAAQPSILLPNTLVKYSCTLCHVETKQDLTLEAIQRHLRCHSSFFAKNPAKYAKPVCRVCGDGLEDNTKSTLSLHFDKVHPIENFASMEDIPKSRWDCSFESDKSAEDTDVEEKKEKVRKRERSPDLNKKEVEKFYCNDKVNILNIDVNETSTDEDDKDKKLEANSGKRLKVDVSPKNDGSPVRSRSMSPDHRRFAGALIPLPYVDFPRKAMFYSCTVCPAESTFTNLTEFEKHRESDKHRLKYGEKFRGNNCQHFPDGAHYNVRVDLNCCFCPAKFTSRPSWLRHFTSHQAPERKTEGERKDKDYCGECRMPILSYKHYERHRRGIARQMTQMCKFCDMNIFKDQIKVHSSAHQNQYFRCLLGNCGKSSSSFSFMYNNVLMNHQEKTHGTRELLNTSNCKFPIDLVRINCRLCSFHILFSDRAAMLDHLVSHKTQMERQKLRPSCCLEFLCRVCNWREDTVQDVMEHADQHLQPHRNISHHGQHSNSSAN